MNYQIIIDGEISRWGYSKTWCRNVLAQYKGKHVDMRISSLGGDLDHGLDIRQQLIDHGDVTAYITGFTASSATIIAMGAKRICMSKYAFFLVHKCSNSIDVWGHYNADELQKLIDRLTENKKENDRIDVILAQMYADRCKKKVSEMMDLLKKGGWLTAQEALEWGFIDEILEDDDQSKTNFTPELRQKFNAFSLPSLPGDASEEAGEKVSDVSQSILCKIYDLVKSFVSGKSASKEDAAPEAANSNSNPAMSKIAIYSAIMAALVIDKMDVNEDGSVTLNQAQLETLNDMLKAHAAQLKAKDDTIKERDNTIADLNTKVDALKKLPGDDTAGIVDDTNDAYMSADEVYDLIKDL